MMMTYKVKYQVEKAMSSLRLAIEYGGKELSPYHLGNIVDALKELDNVYFSLKIEKSKEEKDPMWEELHARTTGPKGLILHSDVSFVPAQDTDGL
jgi:hypothetical protein